MVSDFRKLALTSLESKYWVSRKSKDQSLEGHLLLGPYTNRFFPDEGKQPIPKGLAASNEPLVEVYYFQKPNNPFCALRPGHLEQTLDGFGVWMMPDVVTILLKTMKLSMLAWSYLH